MPTLTLVPLIVHDKDSRKFPAKLAMCGECKGQNFAIFMLEGQDHPHYQCNICDTSYCGTWDGRQCKDVPHERSEG